MSTIHMIRPRQLATVAALSALITGNHLAAAKDPNLEVVMQFDSPNHRVQEISTQFARLNRQDLRRLTEQIEHGIGIRAAWELAKRNGTDRQAIEQFVATTRKCLPVTPPSWWIAEIRRSISVDKQRLSMSGRHLPKYLQRKGGWLSRDRQNVLEKNDSMRIFTNGVSVPIPEAIGEIDPMTTPARYLVAASKRNSAYVAAHSDVSTFYQLFKIDLKSEQLVWHSVVYGMARSFHQGGVTIPERRRPVEHTVSILCSNDAVFVFGIDSTSAYVESFDATDGRPLIRFSTSY